MSLYRLVTPGQPLVRVAPGPVLVSGTLALEPQPAPQQPTGGGGDPVTGRGGHWATRSPGSANVGAFRSAGGDPFATPRPIALPGGRIAY